MVRMARTTMDAQETQPPEMSNGPSRTITSRSKSGLSMPTARAKGRNRAIFLTK